ncbi:hypothetical protein GY45DRAFT_291330 [Cubamyces sp. BRFM 1775]|nr:hypothetical protein GY45DRAFT_291330 [Cubamyces sp. BRFM 1775]
MSQATFELSSSAKYVLVNSTRGDALTLVEQDGVPAITLDGLQYGDNQMWQFVSTAQGHAIRCCKRSSSGEPMYLGITGRLEYGAPIVPSAVPLSWNISLYPKRGLYIYWPDTAFILGLQAGYGTRPPEVCISMNPSITKPSGIFIWCHSCVGSGDPLAGDLSGAPARQANDTEQTTERGLHHLPNTAIHTLTNAQHKTALALDRPSSLVKRGAVTEGIRTEQQWLFIPMGAGYVIESCVKSPNGEPLYLSVDDHTPRSGALVVASRYPAGWRVEFNRASVRIFWPTTNLVVSAQSSEADDDIVLIECDSGLLSKWDDAVVESSAGDHGA